MAQLLKTGKRQVFSGWPMILGWLAMLIFACHASTHMVAAGDTWVAMACGRHFINHGVDTVEPFSANSHKAGPTEEDVEKWPGWAQRITEKIGLDTVKYWHPTGWINQNWLAHVTFYWLTHKSPIADADTLSFNTLVYWKFALYIITIICVYYTGRILGANPALSAVFACFAMFAGRSFFDIRPAGFSNLLVALFLLVLTLTTYRNILYIWLIVPLAVFWCNVHGGYIYLFIMLIPFIALHFLTNFYQKSFVTIGYRGLSHVIIASFVTFIAVIVFNPFHLTNLTHTFVISISKHAEMWRGVNEWHPAFAWNNPVGTGFPFLVLFILSIGLASLWLFSRILKPRFLKAPKSELETQKKRFTFWSKIFGYATAVLICWVIFISFSFVNADPASLFLCALFAAILLLSIYKSIHFIYLTILFTLLALWSANANAGYAGRYIYPFCVLPAYVLLHTSASLLSKSIKFKAKNIIFVTAATVAALVVMTVLVNPFKFEPVWDIKLFLGLQRIWRSRYEANLGLTYKHLFNTLYFLNIISVIVWLTIPYLKKMFHRLPDKITDEHPASSIEYQTFQLPKIDLVSIAIAALTVYMGIRSRRFITIAAIAACPIMAMFIDQIIRMILATRNFHRNNNFCVRQMPLGLQRFFIILAAATVLMFGTWWGARFKCVYLDPWITDPKLSSVFMRMTASDAKPFYACDFIKMNKLEGKMFNYWTEGGFIAYGQQPDQDTGRTALQLFMDGRAQAAYEPKAYVVWSEIMFGGRIAAQLKQNAKLRKRKLTISEYAQIGQWVSKQLKKHNVWICLMPVSSQTETLVQAISRNPDWPMVFFNNKQKLFVDITTPQGKELLNGIFNGKTLYPDDFSRDMVLARNLFLFGEGEAAREQGLDFAIKAFKLNPSEAPMFEILLARRFKKLRPRIDKFCKDYIDIFEKNKKLYIKQDGYYHKLRVAWRTSNHLEQIVREQRNIKLAEFYASKEQKYNKELKKISQKRGW